MKKTILLGSIFVILALLIMGCYQKVSNKGILASFDKKQIVKASELDKEISELPEWKQDKYRDKAGKEEYLTLMAESRMILQVANDRKLEKNPDIIKQVKEFQDQLMRDELNKREVDDKVKVTDGDIEVHYGTHKAEFVQPEQVVVTEITQKDEAKAKDVLAKIKAGADFTQLAKDMDAKGESFGPGKGSGGKTIAFSRASYSTAKNFVETTFNLKPGEISDIIVQPYGQDTFYMIARLDERTPSKQKELSEVKDDVKREVDIQKKRERIDQWLTVLKREKNFKIYPDRISIPVEKKKEETSGTTGNITPTEQEGQKAEDKSKDTSKYTSASNEKKPDQQPVQGGTAK